MKHIHILADASLPLLKEAFPQRFQLTTYTHPEQIPKLLTGQDVLIVRSTVSVNHALLGKHKPQIVATASSGSDNLDYPFLLSNQITALDAKGSNALSVADYVLSSIAYLQIHNQFKGKRIGIIGVGAVGSLIQKRLEILGFEIVGYDPLRALSDPSFINEPLSTLFQCDLLCIHANYHETPPHPTNYFINREFLSQLKSNTVILNASRGGIVDERALIESLAQGKKLIYCTDVYEHEPDINPEIVALATLCTPHIAGHSIEAKNRAVTMLSEKIHAIYQLPYPAILSQREQEIDPFLSVLKEKKQTIAALAENFLSRYNPGIETEKLKQSPQTMLRESFLTLRKQHSFRHNFPSKTN